MYEGVLNYFEENLVWSKIIFLIFLFFIKVYWRVGNFYYVNVYLFIKVFCSVYLFYNILYVFEKLRGG